ncbi:MAG: BirA family biotin operon repressor/biotin-[acetyl-CoA-carboxylase] ligase [Thermoproteota archaeon]|jgi:BirA family biotin operon repressor/biotin-[acetyl-CoA-carboxylase] ligase
MVKKIILENVHSTQDYIKKLLNESPEILQSPFLVLTKNQLEGRGRGNNKWYKSPDGIAMSCLVAPSKPLTLTSLEMALIIVKFFKANFNTDLLVKWPNDIYTLSHKKTGGILIQIIEGICLVGIGLNINYDQKLEKEKYGYIFTQDNSVNPEQLQALPESLYHFILNNRINSKLILSEWNNSCFHLNKKIKIIDNETVTTGLFIGLGENGEALLQEGSVIHKVYNGSLFIID